MPDKGQEPTQRTEKGLEIPVPKRKEVMDAFRKITRGVTCHVCGEPIRGTRYVRATIKVDGKLAPAAIHEACMPPKP